MKQFTVVFLLFFSLISFIPGFSDAQDFFYTFFPKKELENTVFVYADPSDQGVTDSYYIVSQNYQITEIESFSFHPGKSVIRSKMKVDNGRLMMEEYSSFILQEDKETGAWSPSVFMEFYNSKEEMEFKGLYVDYTKKPEKKEEINIAYKIIPSYFFPMSPDFWMSFFYINGKVKKREIGSIYFIKYGKSILEINEKENGQIVYFENYPYTLREYTFRPTGFYSAFVPEISFGIAEDSTGTFLYQWIFTYNKEKFRRILKSREKMDYQRWKDYSMEFLVKNF